MKKTIIFFLPLIIGTIAALGGFVWWRANILPPSNNEEKVRVVIERGMSAERIGYALQEAGVVKNAFAFKLFAQLNDKTKNIPPGEFLVPQNLNMEQVFEFLLEGPEEYWVTIPEGFRREEIPGRFIQAFGLTGDEAQTFRSEFLNESKALEGYLFPDSYLFPPDVTAARAVSVLRSTFSSKIGSDYESKAARQGLTLHEAVTMASLIERETITDEERPVVAGIMFNRMEDGMPLQIDATVQYAIASKMCGAKQDCDWWVSPTRADLTVQSSFNTYQITGLPPSPIANPGIGSLMAVVEPEDSDYYYYIHADGQIYYAETLDQHNQNVRTYLR